MTSSASRRTAAVGVTAVAGLALVFTASDSVRAQEMPPGMLQALAGGGMQPGPMPFDKVTEGLEKVVSFIGDEQALYDLYTDKDEGKLIGVLPRGYEKQLLMIAPTVAGGDEQAGVMGGTIYAQWKKIGNRLALMAPNFFYRSSGDKESQRSVDSLYTDRVLLDLPILSETPDKRPVVDMKKLLVDNHMSFFGPGISGFVPPTIGVRSNLATISLVKAFPQNLEIQYKAPDRAGRMISLHYSIRMIPENKSYKPREADSRAGYFNLLYNEMGQPEADSPWTRYIARWQIEKADPKAKMSPPKEPLVWYIEHTTPIRYRRFVREGILAWNEAFEEIGIVNALEVYQQDAASGAHMEKDPEDARYNFFRWNTSNQGYAIGPSRWDPRTGQILDADVVWHAGLTNAVRGMLKNLSGEVAVQHFSPETLAWLDEFPEWDPRVVMAESPTERRRLINEAKARVAGEIETPSTPMTEVAFHASTAGPEAAMNAAGFNNCRIGDFMSLNFALMDAVVAGGIVNMEGDEVLDGLPEAFVGAMIKYIAAHEVGHCLGLQHNFSASTINSLSDLNTEGFDGPVVGSVMEYAAPNINADDGEVQGPYATPVIGPYDEWVIAYGYGADDQLEEVLARTNDEDIVWHAPIATIGPDPRAQTWDLGSDSLEFGRSRMRIVEDLKSRLTEDLVEDGDSWAKSRQRWNALIGTQVQTAAMASRWVGGSYENRGHKGDPGDKNPIEDIPAAKQREALQFVIDNTFNDDAYGISQDMLYKMTLEFFPDGPGYSAAGQDPAYTVHDTVGAVQSIAMTLLLNPTTLRRVYDNEFRTAGQDDIFTLAELFETVTDATWSELENAGAGAYSASNPMISSFRRNLQREYVNRMLYFSSNWLTRGNPSSRTIKTLARQILRDLNEEISAITNRRGSGLDPYTRAHLSDLSDQITRALDYQMIDLR